MGINKMSNIVAGVASTITEKTTSGISDAISSSKNMIKKGLLGKRIMNPFCIYHFTIKLYWLLCFKLKYDNTFQTEEEYYTNIVINNFLEELRGSDDSNMNGGGG